MDSSSPTLVIVLKDLSSIAPDMEDENRTLIKNKKVFEVLQEEAEIEEIDEEFKVPRSN